MSLPAGQRRALNQIEKALADDHPSLGPLFAIFTGLTVHEAMPVTERVTARPRWWQPWKWPAVTVLGLAMVTVALVILSLTLPSRQTCPDTVFPVAGRTPSAPSGRQPACATLQNKPGETSQGELNPH